VDGCLNSSRGVIFAGSHRTRPYTPRTNGKAERFIQTLCKEWAYAMVFTNSEERNSWLPLYLSIYNRLRKHTALGCRSPQQRLVELLG
jgi:transposase InsO family protein